MKWLIAGVLAVVLAACASPSSRSETERCCLVIRKFPSQVVLGNFRLPEDRHFSLTFIHSVSETPVRDDYQIIAGRIVQMAETFQAHGAGLPSGLDEPGVTGWELHDGRFVIHMQRPITKLVVRTDRNYRNRLHIDGNEINLNDWQDQALEMTAIPCAGP